jgi:glycerol-3-phosphate cytidylyltransferase
MSVIGYTTGVFDLFHIGHLNVLRRAKEECDHLIVGVTTDELVQNRKSKTPVIPFKERMEIVRHIIFVDKVVAQSDMDKMKAWQSLRFNKMMVGSDWKDTVTWNKLEKDFASVNVDILYLPYTQKTSSTKLTAFIDKFISE